MSYNYNMGPDRGVGIYDNRDCGFRNDNLYLAISTVPMQKWRQTYRSGQALNSGTMFSELDLPFLGGNCK